MKQANKTCSIRDCPHPVSPLAKDRGKERGRNRTDSGIGILKS